MGKLIRAGKFGPIEFKEKSRDYVFSLIIVVIISQSYFYIIGSRWNYYDCAMDFSLVFGSSFLELFKNLYQQYTYGILPMLTSWGMTQFFSPLMAFRILRGVTSVIIAILITDLTFRYNCGDFLLNLLFSVVLSCLFLNPEIPLFSWKQPYTISATMGVIFTLFFFISSINYSNDHNFRYLLWMTISGLFAVSTKLEFAFIILAYYVCFIFFIISNKRASASKNVKNLMFLLLLFLLTIVYANWQKYLPPILRIGEWNSDSLLYSYFPPRASTVFLSGFSNLGSRVLCAFRLLSIDLIQLFDMSIQFSFFASLMLLQRSLNITASKKKALTFTLIFVYFLYMGSIIDRDIDRLFINCVPVTILIAIFYFPRISSDTRFLLFGLFSIFFAIRVMLNIGFKEYSIFFGIPVFIFFLSLIYRFLPRILLIVILILLYGVLGMKINNYHAYLKNKGAIVRCADNNEYRVSYIIKRIIDVIRKNQKKYPIKTISSAKNIPFLNACLEKPNPLKLLINIEYPILFSKNLRSRYMKELDKTWPDMFVYTEISMLAVYLIVEKSYNTVSIDDIFKKSNDFKSMLSSRYEQMVKLPIPSKNWPDIHTGFYVYYGKRTR